MNVKYQLAIRTYIEFINFFSMGTCEFFADKDFELGVLDYDFFGYYQDLESGKKYVNNLEVMDILAKFNADNIYNTNYKKFISEQPGKDLISDTSDYAYANGENSGVVYYKSYNNIINKYNKIKNEYENNIYNSINFYKNKFFYHSINNLADDEFKRITNLANIENYVVDATCLMLDDIESIKGMNFEQILDAYSDVYVNFEEFWDLIAANVKKKIEIKNFNRERRLNKKR